MKIGFMIEHNRQFEGVSPENWAVSLWWPTWNGGMRCKVWRWYKTFRLEKAKRA